MEYKQYYLNKLMEKITDLLSEMAKFNTSEVVIGDKEGNDHNCSYKNKMFNTLCNSLENLATVALLAEEISKSINKELEND